MSDIELVAGIGDKLAKSLRSRGIKTRADLKKIINELPIAAQVDLKYNPVKRIPNANIKNVNAVLRKIFRKHSCKYEICGSYRRNEPYSSDIDILLDKTCLKGVKGKNYVPIITSIINDNRIHTPYTVKLVEPYSAGPDRISALFAVKLNPKSLVYYKVDFFLTEPAEWAAALVYATGSKLFNIRIRAVAKKRGYKLNQRGLFDANGNRIPVRTERELFKKIKVTWRDPQDRSR